MTCPRDLFVANALAVDGLSAGPYSKSRYLDLLCTNAEDRADPKVCAGMLVASSCALVVRGLWLRAGVRHPVLLNRYRIGDAVTDIVEIAKDADALLGADAVIGLGDVVIIDGPEHVLTVVKVDGEIVGSIDGGQRNGAVEAIAYRDRVYSEKSGSLGGRVIKFVVDAMALAQAWKIGQDTIPTPPPEAA